MNRREFGRSAGVLTVAALVMPSVLAETTKHEDLNINEFSYLKEIGWSPEDLKAWENMRKFERHVKDIHARVGKEFPLVR